MIVQSASSDSPFRKVAKGLVDLHHLIRIGEDDSPEAEDIRDELDAPWDALSKDEEERAGWLSEDLYAVGEDPATRRPKERNPQAQQQLEEANAARENGEWDRALLLLRRSKEYILPAALSYFRGSIWLDAGYPEVATMFFGHAAELDPDNPVLMTRYVKTLTESDPSAAGLFARKVLSEHEMHCLIS